MLIRRCTNCGANLNMAGAIQKGACAFCNQRIPGESNPAGSSTATLVFTILVGTVLIFGAGYLMFAREQAQLHSCSYRTEQFLQKQEEAKKMAGPKLWSMIEDSWREKARQADASGQSDQCIAKIDAMDVNNERVGEWLKQPHPELEGRNQYQFNYNQQTEEQKWQDFVDKNTPGSR